MNIQNASSQEIASVQASFINKVYAWMCLALVVTGFVALRVASSEGFVNFLASTPLLMLGIFGAEIYLVIKLSRALTDLSVNAAIGMFLLYSALNGLFFSFIFLVYTTASIASTFFITAGTFGVMSVYGYITKKDLSSWGNILFMGLIGIIIASVVNMFLQNETLYWIVSYAGVLIFVGLTAYDTQKIKEMSMELNADSEEGQKGAIMGALRLYLDFVNMFIFLLRIFGNRR